MSRLFARPSAVLLTETGQDLISGLVEAISHVLGQNENPGRYGEKTVFGSCFHALPFTQALFFVGGELFFDTHGTGYGSKPIKARHHTLSLPCLPLPNFLTLPSLLCRRDSGVLVMPSTKGTGQLTGIQHI